MRLAPISLDVADILRTACMFARANDRSGTLASAMCWEWSKHDLGRHCHTDVQSTLFKVATSLMNLTAELSNGHMLNRWVALFMNEV